MVRAAARGRRRFRGGRVFRNRRPRIRTWLWETSVVVRGARRVGTGPESCLAAHLHVGSCQRVTQLPRTGLHALSHGNVRSRFPLVNFKFNFQLTRKRKFIIAGILLTPILIFALYTWSALQWSYSEAERAGFVQKLSKRGWFCKTWAGGFVMVAMRSTKPEKFYFTVRDDNVAEHLNQSP